MAKKTKQSCGCGKKSSSSSSSSSLSSVSSVSTISKSTKISKHCTSSTSATCRKHYNGCKCEQLLYAPLPITNQNQCCFDNNLAWFAPGNIDIDPCCQRKIYRY